MPKPPVDPYADVFRQNELETPITIRDIVYRRLREAIITGKLQPGQRLVEIKIATLLNVSRTPLREAIRILEQERLLERLPQGGVRVPDVSVEEIEQLNEVRATLESLAARKASERVKAGTLSQHQLQTFDNITGLLERMREHLKNEDIISLLQQGQHFHELIHSLSGNHVCSELLKQVIGSMERYRALVPQSRNRIAVDEHQLIADAIRQGDTAQAEMLMHNHIKEAGELYKTTVEQLVRLRDDERE